MDEKERLENNFHLLKKFLTGVVTGDFLSIEIEENEVCPDCGTHDNIYIYQECTFWGNYMEPPEYEYWGICADCGALFDYPDTVDDENKD